MIRTALVFLFLGPYSILASALACNEPTLPGPTIPKRTSAISRWV